MADKEKKERAKAKKKEGASFFTVFLLMCLAGVWGFYLGAHKERTLEYTQKSLSFLEDAFRKSAPVIRDGALQTVTRAQELLARIREKMESRETKQESLPVNAASFQKK